MINVIKSSDEKNSYISYPKLDLNVKKICISCLTEMPIGIILLSSLNRFLDNRYFMTYFLIHKVIYFSVGNDSVKMVSEQLPKCFSQQALFLNSQSSHY